MKKRWKIALKKVVLEYAEGIGKVSETCRGFGVSRSTFYMWRKNYQANGTAGLTPRRPIALHHPNALSNETVEKILELRKSLLHGTATDFLVPGALSWDQNFLFEHLQDSRSSRGQSDAT